MCQALTSGDLLSRMFFPGGDSAFALEEVCGSEAYRLFFDNAERIDSLCA